MSRGGRGGVDREDDKGMPRRPVSLLIRNLPRDIRPEELRHPFERYGPVRDVYLPRDYFTGQPRGFGFVEYYDERDAADAQYKLDRTLVCGREVTIVFAQEERKRPDDMRRRPPDLVREGERGGGRGGGDMEVEDPGEGPGLHLGVVDQGEETPHPVAAVQDPIPAHYPDLDRAHVLALARVLAHAHPLIPPKSKSPARSKSPGRSKSPPNSKSPSPKKENSESKSRSPTPNKE
eukprot:CAMPEP_0196580762 /NCGR_PEP_ID=MMETSP1081-20130531/30455_1 /TAXON_ID=36882 /ORGANISM="Pyramimonas amylifera, Strain CCMP720" /LENGTH=233 /DNA_ID=CAMNT_0041900733 /DNA_START=66 /DNA_END=767 /DNA_ORIENTATION=-